MSKVRLASEWRFEKGHRKFDSCGIESEQTVSEQI